MALRAVTQGPASIRDDTPLELPQLHQLGSQAEPPVDGFLSLPQVASVQRKSLKLDKSVRKLFGDRATWRRDTPTPLAEVCTIFTYFKAFNF